MIQVGILAPRGGGLRPSKVLFSRSVAHEFAVIEVREARLSDPIIYMDTSEIREGKLEEVQSAVEELAAFVERTNPHVLSYRFFFDEDGRRMTVIGVHPDSETLEFHMDAGEEEFRKFVDLLDLSSIAVYGEVSDAVLERLNQKAEMLGSGEVSLHRSPAGFTR